MRTIFVIGGMGSGKSTVLRLFEECGARTLNLDAVGHEVLEADDVRDGLVGVFGDDIIDDAGAIDRKRLAASAFASPEATEALTQITEAPIIERLEAWLAGCRQDPSCPAAVVEVSAFKAGNGRYGEIADTVIAVVAPVEIRVGRARGSGFGTADIYRRICRQPTDFERRQWADFVIENDGSFEGIRLQVQDLWSKLTE